MNVLEYLSHRNSSKNEANERERVGLITDVKASMREREEKSGFHHHNV